VTTVDAPKNVMCRSKGVLRTIELQLDSRLGARSVVDASTNFELQRKVS
jgi:hypothetical protein